MNELSRTEAQRRADEIRVFREELDRLQAEHVLTLTDEQRQTVTRHHDALLGTYTATFDIDRDQQSQRLSLGMRVASFLGAVALAASVFFLFSQYWGLFPTWVQVTLLLASSLGTLLATFWIGRRDPSGYFAKLAAMVAFACFVLNISMLGQMFNITPSDKAFIVWAALAFLLAYTFDLRLLLAAGILCVIAFVSARVGTWSGVYWLYFGERPENFFPAAVLLFCVPLLVPHVRFHGFAALYRIFALLTLLLPVLVLANWGWASYLPFDGATVERSYQVLGFALSAAAIWLGVRREWPETVNTGTVFFVIFLYTKFYDWWWEIVPKFVFFLIIGLTAILFILVMKRLRAAPQSIQEGTR
jgi:uncharacterized membrane protein